MPKAVSKQQAALFGAVAGGERVLPGMSRAEAKERLRGVKVTALPKRARKKKKRA